MSQTALLMLGSVFASILLAVVFGVLSQNRQAAHPTNEDPLALVLGVIALGLFFMSLTVVPMFQFNGLVDMSWSVLVSLQAGIVAFVLAVSLSYD